MNDTTPATPRPWYKKKRVIIPTGIAIIIGASIGLNQTDDNTTSSSSSSKPAVDTTATTGQPVRDGKLEFTIATQKCGIKKVGPQYVAQTAQGTYCLIPITVTNISNDTQMLDASNITATIGTANYEADSMATLTAATTRDGSTGAFLQKINPGNKVTGNIVFDVPTGKKLDTVTVHDSPFSNGATIKLG